MQTYKIARTLVKTASDKGYKVEVLKERSVDWGKVVHDSSLVLIGSKRQRIKNARLKFLATLAHEVGHTVTTRRERTVRLVNDWLVGCNVHVLRNELRATSWAIRFFKKSMLKQAEIKVVRDYLWECYGTYKAVYNPSLDFMYRSKEALLA